MRDIAIGLTIAACVAVTGAHAQSPSVTPAHGVSEAFKLLKLDGGYVKWGKAALGTGAEVTWALAETHKSFPQARNCSELTPVDGMLRKSGVARRAFLREIRAAFRKWEAAANLIFSQVEDPEDADILIGAQGVPVGRAFTNVAYDARDGGKVRAISQALICLNPEQPWKIGFDGNIDVYDLRYTIAHEIGHAIGLDHPSPFGQVMSFRYDEQFRGLQRGDESGAEVLYGQPVESLVAERRDGGAERDRSASFREFALPSRPPADR